MARVPRIGEAEYVKLCDVLGKLASDAPLDAEDRAWLLDVLEGVRQGEDVSKRVTKNKKLSPEAERHFWVAVDVAQHIHDGRTPAHELVAARWCLDADTARKIAQRQRANVDEIRHVLGDRMRRVIEWHRRGGQNSG